MKAKVGTHPTCDPYTSGRPSETGDGIDGPASRSLGVLSTSRATFVASDTSSMSLADCDERAVRDAYVLCSSAVRDRDVSTASSSACARSSRAADLVVVVQRRGLSGESASRCTVASSVGRAGSIWRGCGVAAWSVGTVGTGAGSLAGVFCTT